MRPRDVIGKVHVSFRSTRVAYAVPPLLAFLLGFLGLVQASESGLLGVSSVVTAVAQSGSASNARVAESLEAVAGDHGVTIARVVADPREPNTRRVALVTGAPSTSGAAWLDRGYRDFARTMTTRVEPMADLVHYDTAGSYQVLGDDASRAVMHALEKAGFAVTAESIPIAARFGISSGLDGSWGLIAALMMGCGALCMVGTVGSPRRSAVHRLIGRSTASVVLTELKELRVAVAVLAAVTPFVALALWLYNGFASIVVFAVAVAAFCTALTIPVIVLHAIGTVLSCRTPIPAAMRGTRPSGALVLAVQLARAPAIALLIAATFTMVGSIAVANSGDAARDLRAAGRTVQLWVTPDPRPDSQSQEYWDRIGAFTGRSLDEGDALLTAATEIGTGRGRGTSPALIVDGTYLQLHRLHAADGSLITADPGRISVWLPHGSAIERAPLVRSLGEWELRNAPPSERSAIGGGTLAESEVYTHPGDASTATWLSDAVVIVVPDPATVFSDDQLGSWLSTGDVVFTSNAVAERAIRSSDVGHEFSAVVAVGQDAAERAQHAATAVRIDTAALIGAWAVTVMLSAFGMIAHRRRHGRALFARFTAGSSFVRSNASLVLVETILLAAAAAVAVDGWWDRRPDGSGQVSALDPVARSAGAAGLLAGGIVIAIAAIDVALIAWTGRCAVKTRGRET
ncbi:hypothetical protein ACIPJ2_16870 [Curtobacterium sp. NPDC090217]|uniref:hypothetical protein n=1 Tax=Curtobacterium sp. NPDC090217 TaxID=3363970 RepID=UPI00382819E9